MVIISAHINLIVIGHGLTVLAWLPRFYINLLYIKNAMAITMKRLISLTSTTDNKTLSKKKEEAIGLLMVFDAIVTSRQTHLEITVFVWKSDVK